VAAEAKNLAKMPFNADLLKTPGKMMAAVGPLLRGCRI
jgi:hypothetical protein